MATQKRVKESFSVIGKEGSTRDGEQFVRKLWAEVEARFSEVASLAKKDENGGNPTFKESFKIVFKDMLNKK